jgi:predicted Co/Zn/Cd cation transporter (cation efflux family)
MSYILGRLELSFWNIAIPLLTHSQVLRALIGKYLQVIQKNKFTYQLALGVVIACAGFATGLLAYSFSIIFS